MPNERSNILMFKLKPKASSANKNAAWPINVHA